MLVGDGDDDVDDMDDDDTVVAVDTMTAEIRPAVGWFRTGLVDPVEARNEV